MLSPRAVQLIGHGHSPEPAVFTDSSTGILSLSGAQHRRSRASALHVRDHNCSRYAGEAQVQSRAWTRARGPAAARDLGSERDRTFALEDAAGGPRAILKFSNPCEDSQVLETEAEAALHVTAVDLGLHIAMPWRAREAGCTEPARPALPGDDLAGRAATPGIADDTAAIDESHYRSFVVGALVLGHQSSHQRAGQLTTRFGHEQPRGADPRDTPREPKSRARHRPGQETRNSP